MKMAKESIVTFSNAIMIDKALAAKVATLAAKHGYSFTAEELLELGAAYPISDDDAGKAVAAGGGLWHHCLLKIHYKSKIISMWDI